MNYKSNVDIDLGAIREIIERYKSIPLDEDVLDDIMAIIEENIYYINRDDEE